MFTRALPILAATLLVACGGGSEPEATPVNGSATPTITAPVTPPATAATSGDAPASEVPAALQLTAPLVGGGEIELGALAGRPVLLWFWAPW